MDRLGSSLDAMVAGDVETPVESDREDVVGDAFDGVAAVRERVETGGSGALGELS